MEAFVYMWVDVTTGKRYIGVHKGDLMDGYVCSSKPMLRDYNQRPQDFQRTIIDSGTWKDMLVREMNLITEHNAVQDPMYYNQSNCFGPYRGGSTKGMKMPPFTMEHRARLSESQKGNKKALGAIRSKETLERMAIAMKGKRNALGYRHTEESKAAISSAQKGKPKPKEQMARLAASNVGRIFSEEHKARISMALKGRIFSEEHKARIGAKNKGNKRWLGRKHTEETKAKMSVSRRNRENKKKTK